MKIEYTKVGDYYLPNLYYPEETRPIGCWGMLRNEYLKEHKSGTYTYLLLTARLDSYLADLNEQAQERFELIEAQMRSAEGVTEELKRQNPMEWVRYCNNIRNRTAESRHWTELFQRKMLWKGLWQKKCIFGDFWIMKDWCVKMIVTFENRNMEE